MIKEVYEALKDAGASDEKATKAAEALAETGTGPGKEISEIKERLTRLEGRVTLLQWMLGFNLALTAAVLLMLIRMSLG
jgi:hypothetical protein